MSDVTINRKLNLVVPVDGATGKVYVHSMPIARETFEQYDMVLGRTFAALYELGVGESAGPNIAASILKRIATQLKVWDEVQSGLMAEIFRLTNVIANGEVMPWQVARSRNVLDADDAAEVTGAIVFFILVSSVSRRNQVAARLEAPGRVWGFATTLLTPTAFLASLPTSMPAESSGVTMPVLSVPS